MRSRSERETGRQGDKKTGRQGGPRVLLVSQSPCLLVLITVAELRTDWLTGRTVLLAEHRVNRPNEFESGASLASAAGSTSAFACPFCPGQESQTPPAVYTQTDAAGRWQVRVVPNKYPAVTVDAAAVASSTAGSAGGSVAAAAGAHEVVVESARHVDRVSEISVAEFAAVLTAYRERLAHWHDAGRFEYGLVFKNVGPQAGASLAHLHSQLIALPQLPAAVAAEFTRAEQSCRDRGVCPYCQLVEDERRAGERIVLHGDGLVAFCPFVSLQPCEVWLLPTAHEAWFERRPRTAAADALAEMLHVLVVRIERIVPHAAYNLLVRTAPWRAAAGRCGHWRIEILPRCNSLAGLELATGIHINPISPTRAAQRLRSS